MSGMTNEQPGEQPSRYWQLATEAASNLEERLAAISRDFDAGEISTIDAANERIRILEEHLARLRLLREEYLGGNDH